MSEVRYRRLNQTESIDEDTSSQKDDEFLAQQFVTPPQKIPWKAIIYALVLFLVGSTLLIVGCLIVTEHLDPVQHNDRSVLNIIYQNREDMQEIH